MACQGKPGVIGGRMRKIPLLDLGNVVVKVDFTPFLGWLAEKSGSGMPEKYRSLLSSSLFFDFEFGNIGRSEFSRRVGSLYGIQLDAGELEERFCAIFPGLVEGMEEAIEKLSAEGPLYCLTNTNEIHLEYIRRAYPIMERFTRVFASHEIHRRKPYPGIFRDVANELAVEPARLLFFDDVEANVQGAVRAGLEAHLFEGVEGFLARLKDSEKMDDKTDGGEVL